MNATIPGSSLNVRPLFRYLRIALLIAALHTLTGSSVSGVTSFTIVADPLGDIHSAGAAEGRMVFGDFDNDGDVDALYQDGATAGTGFGYFRNNGNGTFTDFTNANDPGSPFDTFDFTGQQMGVNLMFVVDYDNDGDDDIIDRDTTGGMGAWRNNAGVFALVADPIGDIHTAGVAEGRMVFGDFDNDGDIDILYQDGAAAGSGFGYMRNNGSGVFTDFTNANDAGLPFDTFDFTGQQMGPASMFVVDYDNDGDDDIVDRDTNGGLGVWRNAAGVFSVQADPLGDIHTAGAAEGRMIFGDFDSDGDVDVLYQDGNTSGGGFGFFRNNGSGVFTDFTNANDAGLPFDTFDFTGQQMAPGLMFVMDYDNDKDVDIIDRDGTLSVWRQIGAGDGSPPTLSSSVPADNATGVSVSANISLTFDESVVKGTGNFRIVRTSDSNVVQTIAVTSGQVTGSGTTWTIDPSPDLAGLTSYALQADKGVFVDTDGAVFLGINNNTTLNFTTAAADVTPPDTTINSAPHNPTNSTSASFSFSGTDNVTPPGSLTFEVKMDAGPFVVATSPTNYTGLGAGSHTFQVRARDAAGNTDGTPASYTWTIDLAAPTVTIDQAPGQADPTGSSPINFRVVFNEPVSGFGNVAGDVTLSGTAGATTAVVTEIAPNDDTTYNVAVSGMTVTGTVIASVPANAATDTAGNTSAASTSTDNTVTYNAPDVTPPTVTINQAAGQADPTATSPINFQVVFNEPVTGFGNTDVNLSGTAGATTVVVTETAPNNGTTYNAAVSGMTDDGTIIATVPADAAIDGGGNGNAASTSTDNSVTFQMADTPSVTDATTPEGQQTTSGLVISRNPADGTEVTHFKITGITGGSLFQNDGTTAIANGEFITFAQGNAGLKFTPTAGLYSPASTFDFDVQASTSNADSGLGGGIATATITVNPNLDYGDAPDPTYQTLLASDGARHVVLSTGVTLYLGSIAPDTETQGQPEVAAMGDDTAATDDEEGVALPEFHAAQTSNVTVTVTGSGGVLNAWIDWNDDGDWGDAGEQVATNLDVIAGPNVIGVAAPASSAGGTSFARFRLSTQAELSFTGQAIDGEVEDYTVQLVALAAPQVTCPGDIVTNIPSGDTSVSVSFLATATGEPPPTIHYLLGATPINSPHVFPVGTNLVQVIASNGIPPDATCSFRVIVNRNPIAGDDTLGTKQNTAVNAPIPKLLVNDSDPDGDPRSISGVVGTSTNGGTVVLGVSVITYTPVSGFVGVDRFDYTLSDGRGGTDTGTVVVTVTSTNAPSANQISVTPIPGGWRVRFSGIPTQQYVIQYADSSAGPWFDLSPVLTAGSTGLIQYDDIPGAPIRFYRTRVGP